MAPSAIDVYQADTYEANKTCLLNAQGAQDGYVPGKVMQYDPAASTALVQQIIQTRVNGIDTNTCAADDENAFFVADLGEVYRQHMRWKSNLPRIKPFYAVKCNPDEQVLRLLAKLGTGFDCASKAEIDLVLGIGVGADRIIYAQPCKTKSYLRHAAQFGVKRMTFDNADELYKIKSHYPDAETVLRILTDDSASLCRLSTKFGADLTTARELLGLAKEFELNVVGVSFHVGSGAADPSAFDKAVRDARWVFEQAEHFGHAPFLLDVGGGFVDETFEVFAATLNQAVDDYFPSHIQVIAEPGRYYTAKAFTLAANIIARREVSSGPGTPISVSSDISGGSDTSTNPESSYMLYLNDGVYGNFSNIIFDHQHPAAKVLNEDVDSHHQKLIEYSIWGPTCDGIDVISESCFLPAVQNKTVLDVGDWLYFDNMGAYTKCSATRFNGFSNEHETIYISSEVGASALLGL